MFWSDAMGWCVTDTSLRRSFSFLVISLCFNNFCTCCDEKLVGLYEWSKKEEEEEGEGEGGGNEEKS